MNSKYLRLLRPLAWITFLLPFSVGIGVGVTSQTNLLHIIFGFIAFSCWMSYSFVVNALTDIDVDKFHNGRSKDMDLSYQPLVTDEITKKESRYLCIVFFSSSLLFAWLIHPFFFTLILIGDVLGSIYSMPPLRFKAKPVGDILCNTAAGGLMFVAGLSIGGANMNLLMIAGAFIMASIFYIPTVVTDYSFDKKAGLTTSAVFFSPKKLLHAMYPLTILLVVLMVLLVLTANLELQILALLIIIYTVTSTVAANIKLQGKRLYLHENWILVPFLLISISFVVYGILKLFGLVIAFSN